MTDLDAILAMPREVLALHILSAILDHTDVQVRARGRRAVLRISVDPEMLDVLAMFNSHGHEDDETSHDREADMADWEEDGFKTLDFVVTEGGVVFQGGKPWGTGQVVPGVPAASGHGRRA